MKTQLLILALGMMCCAYAEPIDFKFYERTEEGTRIDKAAVKMLKTAYTIADDKNVVMSPVAVLMLLNLYISNSEPGKAQAEVLELCGEANLSGAYSTYHRLASHLSNYGTSALNFKNKVYVSKDYTLTDKFAQNAKGMKTDVDNINFHDLKSAAKIINDWAEEETKGHIKNVISEDMLRSDMATAMFNVIFFEGHWNVPFDSKRTVDKDFYVDKNTTVKKPMMRLNMPLMYGENKEIGARFVELPYKEDDFRMIITLPDEVDGLTNVLDKLSVEGVLDDVYKLTVFDEVTLELPRFNVEADLNLKQLLPQLGVKTIFAENQANIVKDQPIGIGKMFQKAFIKVNEEGSTAGAFTGILTRPMAALPTEPVSFIVNRPFAFTILQKSVVLFTGTYAH